MKADPSQASRPVGPAAVKKIMKALYFLVFAYFSLVHDRAISFELLPLSVRNVQHRCKIFVSKLAVRMQQNDAFKSEPSSSNRIRVVGGVIVNNGLVFMAQRPLGKVIKVRNSPIQSSYFLMWMSRAMLDFGNFQAERLNLEKVMRPHFKGNCLRS